MGAHDYIVTIKETDQGKVKQAWDRIVENDSYESGSGSYAGNATTMRGRITFYDRKLSSENEAREFCLDKHEKWSGPVAVSFYLPAESTKTDEKRKEKAQDKLHAVWNKQYETVLKIVQSFAGRKSKLVTCKGCDSRLSHSHLTGKLKRGRANDRKYMWGPNLPTLPVCPVCNESLLSETDQKRIKAQEEKVEAARKACNETQQPKPSKKLAWAVGGWAAS